MWWKLVGLVLLSAVLIFAVIPIRTRTVVYDPVNEPSPAPVSLVDTLGAMYLTPGTALLILVILVVASFVAFKVLRGHW